MKSFFKILIFFIVGIIIFKSFYTNTFTQNRINYSIYVNGELSNTFPDKDNYDISVVCDNAKAEWDYDNWKLIISNSEKINDICYLEFTSIDNKSYINEYIINQYTSGNIIHGASSDAGQIVKENGYRYEGSDPYNYVLFNNELWRIIGVFETTLADGTTKQYLTKIIRNETIGSFAYNKNNENIWEYIDGNRSSLNILLNDYYYKSLDGTASGECFFSKYTKRICNYKEIGIRTNFQGLVEEVIWNLGGASLASSVSITSNDAYIAERESNVFNSSSASSKSIGYIGLMYPSDYGYSVLEENCPRNTLLYSYDTQFCAGRTWLLNYAYEMMITPIYNQNAISVISSSGRVYSESSSAGDAVRPVLYLKSDVYIANPESADGSISNPYVLKI